MKYVLFLGGKVGYEALTTLVEIAEVSLVFIEKEHEHEKEKFFGLMAKLCEQNSIVSSFDLSRNNILSLCKKAEAEVMMCFGYRRMVGSDTCNLFPLGCFGSHFAPLPRYRGFAPLNWLLINGESETAVNIFRLSDEVDSGDIIAKAEVPILYEDDINTLLTKCIEVLPQVIKHAVDKLETGDAFGLVQDNSLASYTCSRNPDDGRIEWNASSNSIYNLVRALTYPFPGAYTLFQEKKLFIWKCTVVDEKPYIGRVPGKVISIEHGRGVKVLTGDGSVLIEKCSIDDDEILRADKLIKSVRITFG